MTTSMTARKLSATAAMALAIAATDAASAHQVDASAASSVPPIPSASPVPGSPSASAATVQSTDDSGGIGEIIVTAEKRSTSLQRTPIAVTALAGDKLSERQVTDVTKVATLVPSFKASQANGFAQLTIRGIGSQNFAALTESAVAVNLNEVYLSRPISFLTGLFDVASVEVLRGPQGTLYGRNATAGSVNIATVLPTTDFTGSASFTYGNYNERRGDVAIGGALLNDKVLVRVAGFIERRDGYGRNIATNQDVNDKDAYGIRGTAIVKPVDNVTATFIVEHYRERDAQGGYNFIGDAGLLPVTGTFGKPAFAGLFGGTRLVDTYDVNNNIEPQFYLKTLTLTGKIDWRIGRFSLRSITGYRTQQAGTLTDLDASQLNLGLFQNSEPARQFSQEVQAHYDSSRLNVTLGGYYYHEKDSAFPQEFGASSLITDPILALLGISIPPRAPVFLNFVDLGGTIYTDSGAVFGQATWEIVDRLKITAGFRYSSDRKHLYNQYSLNPFTPFDPNAAPPPFRDIAPRTFSSTTPKAGIEYQASRRTLLYASYAQGFKAGSFDPSTGLPYQPERLTSYEAGAKTTLFDNSLRLNGAAFYYDYSNLQVAITQGTGIVTANAAAARVYGLESELTYLPVAKLELSLNGSYLSSKYTNYVGVDSARPLLPSVDLTGHRLNNAPEFSGTGAVQYTDKITSGSIAYRVEGEYSSRFFFTPGNYDQVSQSPFFKLNAFITYNDRRGISATLFGRNLTNRLTKTSENIATVFLGTPINGSYAPPRTFGIQLGYRF